MKYFLEYCLYSILNAHGSDRYEIIVVDNHSSDGSPEYIRERFPQVKYIYLDENIGFGKANNIGLQAATGEYVLYLNPDTLVAENTISASIGKIQQDATIGALGVYMMDGSGTYLPESKRGFPDLKTSFFKITNLNTLFPKSAHFNKYYLGHLSESQDHEIDVLPGCFMLMPRSVAAELGGFDPDFFMYGEDIDLSYRVQKLGKKVYYTSQGEIIHFKGESTTKASFNYLKQFYSAMIIFAQKHLSSKDKTIFIPLIRLAIFLKVTLGMFTRIIANLWLPILDAGIILSSLVFTKKYWLDYIKPDTQYPTRLLVYLFTTYIIIWLISLAIGGAYDRPAKAKSIFRPMIFGVLITLALYGLLPEQYRFSRGITLIGAGISTFLIYLLRLILGESTRVISNKVLIIGNDDNASAVKNVLTMSGVDKDIIGYLGDGPESLGKREHLEQIVGIHKIGEFIFCMNDIAMTEIFSIMKKWKSALAYRFYNSRSQSIIGSHSKNNPGELYAFDLHFNISKQSGRRDKRTFDILAAIALLISSPILVFGSKRHLLSHIGTVLLGKKTWVGYYPAASISFLPKIKESVMTIQSHQNLNEINSTLVNQNYAKNYTWQQDLYTLLKYEKNTYTERN